jgi:hypothetical protein
MGVSLMFTRPPEDLAMKTISRSPLLTAASLGEALRAASRQHASAMAYYPGAPVQEQACSCAGLEVTSARYATALREHGVRPGDLVGLVHGTGPGLLACLFGVSAATGALRALLPEGTPPGCRRGETGFRARAPGSDELACRALRSSWRRVAGPAPPAASHPGPP